MPIVTFKPSGRKIEIKRGATLLKAAQMAAEEITWCCGGNAICTTCRCVVEKGAEVLSETGETERDLLEGNGLTEVWRLGCQAKVRGDVTVWIPPDLCSPTAYLPWLEKVKNLREKKQAGPI